MINYLGRYYPEHSFWHSSDPRVKLLLVTVSLIGTVLLSGKGLILMVLLTGSLYFTARVSIKTIGGILWQFKWLIVLPFLANLTIMMKNELFTTLTIAATVTTKLALSLLLAIWLTLVTKPFGIIDGLAKLLKPLVFFRIPVGEFTFFAGLVIRLIPELISETEQIMLAQRLRGIQPDLSWNKSTQWIKCTLIPIFLATLRKSTAIAAAMEARGFRSGQSRTTMEDLHFSVSDVIVVLATLAGLIVLVIWRNR